VLRFVVPDEPVAAARPRVAVQNGHAHAYMPAKTAQAAWRIREHVTAELGPGWEPLAGPLALDVVVYVPLPASISRCRRLTERPIRRPDLDNFCKTCLDGLSPIWRDDSQVVDLIASKRYAVDSAPRWEITVTRAGAEVPDAEPDLLALVPLSAPRTPEGASARPITRTTTERVSWATTASSRGDVMPAQRNGAPADHSRPATEVTS
jgi:Holliday junction resolvase RusA-like endonuclease